MAGTPGALVQAAKNGFNGTPGPMCHDAVLEWLEASAYVDNNIHTKIFGTGDRSAVYAKILVQESDPRIMTMDGLNQLPKGTIIGFWSHKKLMHTIVTLGDRMVAGANNGGIFDPKGAIPQIHNNLHAIFLTSQIGWNAADSTVGLDRYTMHYQAAAEIAKRITGAG